eukprot:gene2704-biopygen2668
MTLSHALSGSQLNGFARESLMERAAPPFSSVWKDSRDSFEPSRACSLILQAIVSTKSRRCTVNRPRVTYSNTVRDITSMMFPIRLAVSCAGSAFSIESSKSRRNCGKDVWYMLLTFDISTIRK